MSGYQRALALHHFCTAYHGGQSSREYAVLSRLTTVHGFRPSRSEEYASCLARAENAEARAIFVRLATAAEDKPTFRQGAVFGYIACCCCSADMMADDMRVERGITMCDDCTEADCDPSQGCSVDHGEDEIDGHEDDDDDACACEGGAA